MMIAKDTQFSAAKAFLHWYLLTCAGLLAGGYMLALLAERSPLLIFGKGNELFSGVVAIAGLAWVVWTVWYIGRGAYRHGSLSYVVRVADIALAAIAAIGTVLLVVLRSGAACCDDD